MEQRCRSTVTGKNELEEKVSDLERAKKTLEKKTQQVRERGGERGKGGRYDDRMW